MFGRGWPLLAPLREGHVPSWPELNGNGLVPCMVGSFSELKLVETSG
jgi:hypothetical protein